MTFTLALAPQAAGSIKTLGRAMKALDAKGAPVPTLPAGHLPVRISDHGTHHRSIVARAGKGAAVATFAASQAGCDIWNDYLVGETPDWLGIGLAGFGLAFFFLAWGGVFKKYNPTRLRTMPDRLPKLIDDGKFELIERGLMLPCRPKAEVEGMKAVLMGTPDHGFPVSTYQAIAMSNGSDSYSIDAFKHVVEDGTRGQVEKVLSYGRVEYGRFGYSKSSGFVQALLEAHHQKNPNADNEILLKSIKMSPDFKSAFRIFKVFVKQLHVRNDATALPYYAEALCHLSNHSSLEQKHFILDFIEGYNAPEAPSALMD